MIYTSQQRKISLLEIFEGSKNAYSNVVVQEHQMSLSSLFRTLVKNEEKWLQIFVFRLPLLKRFLTISKGEICCESAKTKWYARRQKTGVVKGLLETTTNYMGLCNGTLLNNICQTGVYKFSAAHDILQDACKVQR